MSAIDGSSIGFRQERSGLLGRMFRGESGETDARGWHAPMERIEPGIAASERAARGPAVQSGWAGGAAVAERPTEDVRDPDFAEAPMAPEFSPEESAVARASEQEFGRSEETAMPDWSKDAVDAVDEFDARNAESAGRAARFLTSAGNVVAALLSVAFLAGLVIWGVDIVSRDVNGIPVVRAIDGPMRIAPEEPGGERAEHQGLMVNDVAARGVVSDPADRLVLAPPPMELEDEDMTAEEFGLAGGTPADSGAGVAERDLAPPLSGSENSGMLESEGGGLVEVNPGVGTSAEAGLPIASGNSLQDASRNVPQNASQNAPEEAAALAGDVAARPQDATEFVGLADVRPQLRPDGAATASGLAPEFSSQEPDPSEAESVEAISVGDGALRIAASDLSAALSPGRPGPKAQLGAMATRDLARAEWERLERLLGATLVGRETFVDQRSGPDGRQLFLLRVAGFDNGEAVRSFCDAVRSRGPDCLAIPAQ